MTRALALVVSLAALSIAANPPRLMLWAWERDTDLRFLSPSSAGVAYHFANLHIDRKGAVSPYVRRQPLLTAPGAFLMPVIRIDNEWNAIIPNTPALRRDIVDMLVEALRISKSRYIQIDFDAPKSAWPLYRAILDDLRKRAAPGTFISITALISWCGANSWMDGLPVDEIVPMMFRTGYPPAPIPAQFPFAGCRQAAGIELREEQPVFKNEKRRIYAFPGYVFPGNHEWDEKSFSSLKSLFK